MVDRGYLLDNFNSLFGGMAEKLRDGLQNRLPRCDSECHLQSLKSYDLVDIPFRFSFTVSQSGKVANVVSNKNKSVVMIVPIPSRPSPSAHPANAAQPLDKKTFKKRVEKLDYFY